jgi:hypothetical protein
MSFDPRTMGVPVYEALTRIKNAQSGNDTRIKEQKSQSVELYTYLSTWGMLRLKAEEQALSQDGKKDVVKAYFQCLDRIAERQDLTPATGLDVLKNLDTEEYLGISGLGLAIAREFSFWATAVYAGIEGDA